jgi:hypothetical protein
MTTQDLLDDRYGRGRSPVRRWFAGIGIALALTVVGYLGWTIVQGSLASVDADTTSFEVVDEHSVSLGFQITSPTGRDVACAIEAQDEDHGVVGWRVVEIPASAAHSQAFRETIPTTARATTGFVNSCWVVDERVLPGSAP